MAKGGKYCAYTFAKWKTISLPLYALPDSARECTVEIRSKKNCDIKMWLDDASVGCK
jgi:hypothetical protein